MVPVPLADADRLHRRVAHERRAFLHISPDRRDPLIRNAMTAPLLGEAGLIGSMVVANRLTEGTTFTRRRPAAPGDPREPGGRRAGERPARAVAGGAVAAQGAAPVPGLPRPADRPRQPQPVRRAGERRARVVRRRPGAGRPVPRPRQLQGRQRRPRAPGGRPAAHRGRRARPVVRPGRRHGGPARRRRVRGPAARRAGPRRRRHRRVAADRRVRRHVPGPRPGPAGLGEHRHRRQPRR